MQLQNNECVEVVPMPEHTGLLGAVDLCALGGTSMTGEKTEQLLDWTYNLIIATNRGKVLDGLMTEQELRYHAEERINFLHDVPFDVFTKRLLAEIPDSYFANA